jgi:hypothetical protein
MCDRLLKNNKKMDFNARNLIASILSEKWKGRIKTWFMLAQDNSDKHQELKECNKKYGRGNYC